MGKSALSIYLERPTLPKAALMLMYLNKHKKSVFKFEISTYNLVYK